MKYENIPPCPECGTRFENIFEATDHLLDDEDSQEFDPKLTLENGYSLMLGSLLRCLYSHADDARQIKSITQSVYATLYASEVDPGYMKEIIEDMVIHEHMHDFDEQLNELLNNEKPTNESRD